MDQIYRIYMKLNNHKNQGFIFDPHVSQNQKSKILFVTAIIRQYITEETLFTIEIHFHKNCLHIQKKITNWIVWFERKKEQNELAIPAQSGSYSGANQMLLDLFNVRVGRFQSFYRLLDLILSARIKMGLNTKQKNINLKMPNFKYFTSEMIIFCKTFQSFVRKISKITWIFVFLPNHVFFHSKISPVINNIIYSEHTHYSLIITV